MKLKFITGSRADWGLLEKLYSLLSVEVETELYVTGSHLSTEHGLTVDQIKVPIREKIEIVLSGVTPSSISKSMGLAMIGFADVYRRNKPDWVLGLGDRYELFAAMSAAYVAGIPIVHVHGGEETEGSLDNAFRHSISHMASLHFVAAEPYKQRLVGFGIDPNKTFCVGALGCDGLFKRKEQPKNKHFIVAYYGVESELSLILDEIRKIGGTYQVVGGSHDVDQEVRTSRPMDRETFLQELYKADAIIGNSSAGIIEAPAMGVPTINIGDRQNRRMRAPSIINCEATALDIRDSLLALYAGWFQTVMQSDYLIHYKGGNVAERIAEIVMRKMKGDKE